MKILITGGAGFIGSNLSKFLLDKNHEVIAIDNFSYSSKENIKSLLNLPKYEFRQADIANPWSIKEIKADVIVHLASQKIPRYTNAYRTLEENNMMLKNIVSKCLQDKIKIVFASTSDVYGKNTAIPFSEESNIVLGSTKIKRWAYAVSKIYGEHFIIANHDEFGLDFSIARFFGAFGPNHNLTWWGGPQSSFITKAIRKEEIEIHGDGLQTRTFTFIEDTVNALSNLILEEKANGEIFNIASSPEDEISIIGLAKLIWKLVNGSDDDIKLKYIDYKTFGNYEDVMRRVPNIEKIKAYFNYQPKYNLESGLVKTIEWQKNIV
jgi:UDP-glucose 4-epimerase